MRAKKLYFVNLKIFFNSVIFFQVIVTYILNEVNNSSDENLISGLNKKTLIMK